MPKRSAPSVDPQRREAAWANCDFVELVSRFTELETTDNSQYVGLCPFHEESTPSFSINSDRKIFNCFGCDAGGDLFAFVMKAQNCSFPDAIAFLETGAPTSQAPTKRPKAARPSPPLSSDPVSLDAIAQAQSDFASRIFSYDGARTRSYLSLRGITKPTIKRFGVGVAPVTSYELTRRLLKRDFTAEQLVECGLSSPSQYAGNFYDYFRDSRITFPITGKDGVVRGFAARRSPAGSSDASTGPKYLNSRASAIFQKNRLFFGISQALVDLEEAGVPRAIVVVEGYVDVLALAEAGICASVSVMGTAATEEHCRILAAMDLPIYIAFDGDTPGTDAAKRFAATLKDLNTSVRMVDLPTNEDPASLVASGRVDELRERLTGAKAV